MLTEKRQQMILDLLERKQVVTIHEMAAATGASESTIRRDLDRLEARHMLQRVHGGAKRLRRIGTEPSLAEKTEKNRKAKIAIARAASSRVREGMNIFLDAGTTTLQMAPFLKGKQVTIVTNNLPLVSVLAEDGHQVYVPAGKVKARTRALVGAETVKSLSVFRFDLSFLGMNGISVAYGMTTPDPEEAAVKKTALDLSQKTYVLADGGKFGEIAFSRVCALSEALLITDETARITAEMRQQTQIEVVK